MSSRMRCERYCQKPCFFDVALPADPRDLSAQQRLRSRQVWRSLYSTPSIVFLHPYLLTWGRKSRNSGQNNFVVFANFATKFRRSIVLVELCRRADFQSSPNFWGKLGRGQSSTPTPQNLHEGVGIRPI
jgi:hypothetical protein